MKILAALLLTGALTVGWWQFGVDRPLTAEERAQVNAIWNPPSHTRGPADHPPILLEEAAAAITLDTDMIEGVAGLLTSMTLLFALVSKYLLGPMIDAKLAILNRHFVTRQDLILVLTLLNNQPALERLIATWSQADKQ